LIFRQRWRRFRSVFRDLILVALIGIALVLLILILRLLVLGRLLLLRLLLLRLLLRALSGVSGSRGSCRGRTLVDGSSASVIADRRKVSILRRVHLIAIVLVAPCRQDNQHQYG
jgi:hypothetical protein